MSEPLTRPGREENAAPHKDKERLDWCINIEWVVEMDHRGWYLRDASEPGEVIVGGFYDTPLQAIDAGMAITEELDRKDQALLDAAREAK